MGLTVYPIKPQTYQSWMHIDKQHSEQWCRSNLFGSVLGVGRQVVEGVVGLSDPTEEHCDHTCDTNAKEFAKQFALTADNDIV